MPIETRSFSANIENFSSRLDVSLEKAIAEAVVNSIHARATQVDVKVHTFSDGNINCIEVVDNGQGFIRDNLESFFDLHSDHKKTLGGKGVGRATWFKYFSSIAVDSNFKENSEYKQIRFVFEKSSRNIDIDYSNSDKKEQKTSVKMLNFIGRASLNILSSSLRPYLIKEMALLLYRLKDKFIINLQFIESDNLIGMQTIGTSDLPVIEKSYTFDVTVQKEKHTFTLHCIHLSTTSSNKVETGFVAGERTLSSFDAALGLKVKAPTNQYSGQYWLLLESAILNDGKFTSEDRERVVFPEGKDLWGNDVRSEVKEKLASAISAYFDLISPDHVAQRQEIIDEVYDLYPQYAHPQYKKVIDEVSLSTIGRLDRHYLLKKLHEEDFSREYHFKSELAALMKSKNINERSIQEIAESAEKTSEQAKSVLSNYFWYRKAIIDQLDIFINNNEKSEELLHELFSKRYESTSTLNLQNCIWLLDDKFMSFSYFASEGVVKQVINDIYGDHSADHNSRKVMDLFIAFDRADNSLEKDCVIIEFKALGATSDEKANAASQVRRKYAQSIRRHAKNVRNIFVFIVTQIDEETKEGLKSDDFREAVTRYGTMMNYYNRENDAHICFLCATTVIGDAKDRHELFFKLLREELVANQRRGVELPHIM